MGRVRSYDLEDSQQVVDLHKKVFFADTPLPPSASQSLITYYSRALCDNPWNDDDLQSLVYEGDDGRVVGFLGVIARPMYFEHTAIRAAVYSSFMVDPGVRSPIVAAALLKHSMQGPQDLTLGDGGNDGMATIWRAMGRPVFPLFSMKWWHPLRPCHFGLSRLIDSGTRPGMLFSMVASPPCRLVDTLIARAPKSPTRILKPPRGEGRDMEMVELLECIDRAAQAKKLRPAYDERSLQWLLDYVATANGRERFHMTAVVGEDNAILGWYLHRSRRDRINEVLQIGAFGRSMDIVLKHAIHHSMEQGALLVQGRLEPNLFEEIWNNGSMCKRAPWFLAHSRDDEILCALARGDVFLSTWEHELISLTL